MPESKNLEYITARIQALDTSMAVLQLQAYGNALRDVSNRTTSCPVTAKGRLAPGFSSNTDASEGSTMESDDQGCLQPS